MKVQISNAVIPIRNKWNSPQTNNEENPPQAEALGIGILGDNTNIIGGVRAASEQVLVIYYVLVLTNPHRR